MTPSIGRIVHYVADRDSQHYAAIITRVADDGRVDLTIFPPPLSSPNRAWWAADASFDEAGQMTNSWHWPERVE